MGRLRLLPLLAATVLLLLFTDVSANSLYDPTDPILEVDVDTFAPSVYGKKKAFFVEFYSSWCGACIGYAPTFKKFAKQLESWSPIVQVMAVNCAEDKNMPLCREHSIAAFPTIKYFKYGSATAADGALFHGDKHDIATLPLQVAQLVRDDWEVQRPPEWPAFEPIASETTIQDIWNTAPDANLVAVYAQEDPATAAWAATINFASDKRIRTAIARPNHGAVLKEVGSVIDGKLLVYEKGSARPVYVSPPKPSFTEMQEKLAEFLSQAIGHSLDQIAPPAAGEKLAPPHVDPGKKTYDPEVWTDLSQFQLELVDLESALAYMLTREIPRREKIEGEDLAGLKKWTGAMAKYAPGRTPTRRLLFRLNEWLTPLHSVTAEEWTKQVSSLQLELGNPLPAEINWLACKGSKPNLRGYTCGIWSLAHAMSVEAYKIEKNNAAYSPVSALLGPFREFITRFLSCGECAANFAKEAEKHNLEGAQTAEDAVRWLWNTHNSVNTRLSGAPAEDPKHPKRTFPPKAICSGCYRDDDSFDEHAIFQFLLNYYGNVKNDPVKPDPEYTVKTFQDGKVVEAERRHFNPRFGVNGAEKVDDLERAEERLRREQAEAAPMRGGRLDDQFRRDLLGGGAAIQPGSRIYSPFMLVALSVVAVVVILVYCKYRRNRSKFWKTFYYSNDFKLPWTMDSPKQYTA